MMMAVAWVVLAIALAISEVVSVAFYAAFLAAGALAAALSAALGANVIIQAIVFLVVSVLGIGLLRPLVVRARLPRLSSGAPGMIGQTAIVVDAIPSSHEPGHVRIEGERWLAVSADGAPIPQGATVYIAEIKGTTLVVHQ
jgi:membrane protein implicated in regulation of membrane protease activity